MTDRRSWEERAGDITAAITRFQQNTTTGEHDGRLIAENLATEAGFNGTPNSRRTQVQHYFTSFPGLRLRWQTVVREAKIRSGQPTRDLAAELKAAQVETARLREELVAVCQVSDLRRRKIERLERLMKQHQIASPLPENVVELRPSPGTP